MVCLCCAARVKGRVCQDCLRTFRPTPEQLLPGGIRLIAPFEHEGAAKVLMHHLKYRGITEFAEMAAELMVGQLPRLPLVPIPRAWSRRVKYGVDPARVIAKAIGRRIRVPVLDVLAPHIHSPRRAGNDHSRPVRPFRLRAGVPPRVVIVDDVVTTGATVLAAVASVGEHRVGAVAAANMVSSVSNLTAVTSPEPGSDRVWQQF